jgi:Zn-dependent M28 family amino/carboxypeptidase
MAGPLTIRPVPGVELHVVLNQRLVERTSAPNVVGILEGSDPVLKNEYVVITAHMDHVGTAAAGQGCEARGADSICNGADDDASGSAAVLELAEAFTTALDRPRRSLVFMTVSGEERGLWGSAHWVAHATVPLANVVANINNDMVGRSDNFKDSIAVIGREHSDLGATLDRVATAHPELRLTPVKDPWPEENLFFRSDHYNFARAGIPALFFTGGLHRDYHQVSDTPDRIDADYAARYARLVYFLTRAVADQTARPQWNPESRARIVQ